MPGRWVRLAFLYSWRIGIVDAQALHDMSTERQGVTRPTTVSRRKIWRGKSTWKRTTDRRSQLQPKARFVFLVAFNRRFCHGAVDASLLEWWLRHRRNLAWQWWATRRYESEEDNITGTKVRNDARLWKSPIISDSGKIPERERSGLSVVELLSLIAKTTLVIFQEMMRLRNWQRCLENLFSLADLSLRRTAFERITPEHDQRI